MLLNGELGCCIVLLSRGITPRQGDEADYFFYGGGMLRRCVLFTFVLFHLAPARCLGSERFQLESELYNNFTATGTTAFLTVYTYDADGNRVRSRVWSGSDSMVEHMSSVNFIYSSNFNSYRRWRLLSFKRQLQRSAFVSSPDAASTAKSAGPATFAK